MLSFLLRAKLTPTQLETRKRHLTNIVGFVLVLVGFVLVWELYKVVGKTVDGVIPGTDIKLRPPPDNRSMPHSWDIFAAWFRPVRRGGDLTIWILIQAALFTLREALVGFLVGGLVGFGIGVGFVRSQLAERAFMPYVVASQTVPILAIAPMVVVWGGRLSIPQWVSVSIIAAYLTFFPVAINTLRGLRSPSVTSTELMRSYAATPKQVLWKLQVPAALPYIFTALKISASASVIGAIIGELPAGFRSGLGRALLEFSQQFTAGPERLFAAAIMSALAGILFVSVIVIIETRTLGSRTV